MAVRHGRLGQAAKKSKKGGRMGFGEKSGIGDAEKTANSYAKYEHYVRFWSKRW